MERELWPRLYRLIRSVGESVRQKNVSYQPHIFVAVYLWAVIHDRPTSWSCQARQWSTTHLRPARLPSPSTMSTRLKTQAVAAVMRGVEDRLRQAGEAALLHVIDGKPLVVGGLSHDPDARNGHGAGKIAKGYKLYALWGCGRCPRPGRSTR